MRSSVLPSYRFCGTVFGLGTATPVRCLFRVCDLRLCPRGGVLVAGSKATPSTASLHGNAAEFPLAGPQDDSVWCAMNDRCFSGRAPWRRVLRLLLLSPDFQALPLQQL